MKNQLPTPARPQRQRRPDGKLVGVIGASRSAKTEWVVREVAPAPRLLLWDYKGEWRRYRCRRVATFAELAQCVRPGAPAERIAFNTVGMSDRRLFEVWCRFAFVWLRADMGTLVIEETSSVTTPSKAPPAYGDILRMGLGFGCDIYAITQRPQESDKTAYGNATVLHVHQLATRGDRAYVVKNFMDVDPVELEQLQPGQWIERHNTGDMRRGRVGGKKIGKPARDARALRTASRT